MIRAGLFLYDHLARREQLAASAAIDLRTHIAGEPLQAAVTDAASSIPTAGSTTRASSC